MKGLPWVSLAVLSLLLLAPVSQAHAAPPARPFETRLLHDHGDDASVENLGGHGFDAIALDVRTAWLAEAGEPALVLRFLLDGGCAAEVPLPCPELRLATSFLLDGSPAQVEVVAAPDGAWTGDAARFVGPEELGDGTRFAMEAWVPYSQIGAAPGAVLTEPFVRQTAGGQEADSMPEGAVPGVPDPLGSAFTAASYVLGAPDGYVRITLSAADATSQSVAVQVQNLLPVEQEVALAVAAPDGVTATFEGASDAVLAANYTGVLNLRVAGAPDAAGNLTVTATTPLGGWAAATLPLRAAPAGNATAAPSGHHGHGDDHPEHGMDPVEDVDDKDAPGPALPALLGALAAVAGARRMHGSAGPSLRRLRRGRGGGRIA